MLIDHLGFQIGGVFVLKPYHAKPPASVQWSVSVETNVPWLRESPHSCREKQQWPWGHFSTSNKEKTRNKDGRSISSPTSTMYTHGSKPYSFSQHGSWRSTTASPEFSVIQKRGKRNSKFCCLCRFRWKTLTPDRHTGIYFFFFFFVELVFFTEVHLCICKVSLSINIHWTSSPCCSPIAAARPLAIWSLDLIVRHQRHRNHNIEPVISAFGANCLNLYFIGIVHINTIGYKLSYVNGFFTFF